MGLGNLASKAGNKLVGAPLATAAHALGIARVIATHPWQTSAAVVGIGSLAMYGSSATQSIPVGPTSSQPRPGTSKGAYDLGGTGDLVFAMHRNR